MNDVTLRIYLGSVIYTISRKYKKKSIYDEDASLFLKEAGKIYVSEALYLYLKTYETSFIPHNNGYYINGRKIVGTIGATEVICDLNLIPADANIYYYEK